MRRVANLRMICERGLLHTSPRRLVSSPAACCVSELFAGAPLPLLGLLGELTQPGVGRLASRHSEATHRLQTARQARIVDGRLATEDHSRSVDGGEAALLHKALKDGAEPSAVLCGREEATEVAVLGAAVAERAQGVLRWRQLHLLLPNGQLRQAAHWLLIVPGDLDHTGANTLDEGFQLACRARLATPQRRIELRSERRGRHEHLPSAALL